MTAFDSFSPATVQFLADLKENNSKEWFAANKASYETHLKIPAEHCAAAMAENLQDMTGTAHHSKIFRIYRDVRFSKDKTPYNAHLHMAFTPQCRTAQPPMWFFGLSPAKLSLGCGVFQYDKEALNRFRNAMAGPEGTKLIRLSSEMRDQGIRISDPDLKRVPPGFDKDRPNAEALRRKGFGAWIDIEDTGFVTRPDLVSRTAAQWHRLMPVFTLLSELD